MNPNNGDIYTGEALKQFELAMKEGTEEKVQMVPVPEKLVSALNNLSPHQRQMWARRNRPTLDQLVEAGADLTAVQKKTLQKRERRRLQFLAGKR